MDCYLTTVGKNVLLWLLAVICNEIKMLPLKMGLPSLGVYYISVSSYKECYPTNVDKDFFDIFLWFYSPEREGHFLFCNASKGLALVCCAVTSNEAKIFPQKMSLPSLGVAFSQVRYL